MKKMIIITLMVMVGCSKPKNTENYSNTVYNYTVTIEPEVEVTEEKSLTEVSDGAHCDRYHKQACPYTGRSTY